MKVLKKSKQETTKKVESERISLNGKGGGGDEDGQEKEEGKRRRRIRFLFRLREHMDYVEWKPVGFR